MDTYVSITEDGVFGEETEAAVLEFQEQHALLADGIVGPNTFKGLERAFMLARLANHSPGADSFDHVADAGAAAAGGAASALGHPVRLTFERVPADSYKEGYDRVWLRSDVAAAYQKVYDEVHRRGAKLTSSGGRRALTDGAGPNRSAISFHYTGRALDLFIYSGMVNPALDPYVVIKEADRYHRVYARCSEAAAEKKHLERVVTYARRDGSLSADGFFFDLTQVLHDQGFSRIRARPLFERGGSPLGAEWWHFQYEAGLVQGLSTFGGELEKVYARRTLESSPVWQYRDRVFGVSWA